MPPRLVRPQNLIESFRIAAQEYRQKPVYLTNNQKVNFVVVASSWYWIYVLTICFLRRFRLLGCTDSL